jgi:transaldolase
MKLSELKVKIYADGADLKSIIRLNEDPLIKGFTTNPTLMRRAGVTDYERFAKEVLEVVDRKPISFEVFSDEPSEMLRQALKISKWGNNVFVKIPVVFTNGNPTYDLIKELGECGVCVNVTAVLGLWQVSESLKAIHRNVPSVISIFAGRVADTGLHAREFMFNAVDKMKFGDRPNTELLWASVREPLNIYEANETGCDIITVPEEILKKAINMQEQNLEQLSIATAQMFFRDAAEAGYTL